MLPTRVLYSGKDEPLPERIPLRAGPLSLVYEAGDLRYIRLGEHEILRRLYVAVRDQNWGTILPSFSNIQMAIGEDAFQISYDVENRQGGIDFRWRGVITGGTDGTIRYSMDGQAHSTFLRNRIGFCVLHPMACAGARARIGHVDGTTEESHFPVHIAPQLVIDGLIKPVHPFEEMRALAHEVTPGVWAEVRFVGEIFETEDQRNWTDASYKTYGTPLRLAFPVEIQAGEAVVQSITLTLQGEVRGQSAVASEQSPAPVQLSIQNPNSKIQNSLPRLGLGIASHGQPLSEGEISRLRALNLAHLRVDLALDTPAFAATLRQATAEAAALGVQLEIALHLTDNAEAELQGLRAALAEIAPPVARWLVFHRGEKTTSDRWLTLARTALADYNDEAPVGGGTNVYFTELNRSRPAIDALDLVAYSVNPQVHAFDNASLVETLAAQAVTATSARQFCGDRPLAVTPVTLQPRFNPNATGPEPEPGPGELPPQVDRRQMSLFGAGWTLGSLKYLAESGEVSSITYYETTGWRGVMETANGSPLPTQFQSIPGGVFPLYHVLADVGEFAGGEVIPLVSAQPLVAEGLLLRKEGQERLLLANLTDQPQTISLGGLGAGGHVRLLDEDNAETAMADPDRFRDTQAASQGASIPLKPYAYACLDR
jgi:D-apionolactonase